MVWKTEGFNGATEDGQRAYRCAIEIWQRSYNNATCLLSITLYWAETEID